MKHFLATLVVLLSTVTVFASKPGPKAVLDIAERVFDWQQAHQTVRQGRTLNRWEFGAYYSGLIDLYKVDPKIKYLSAMTEMGTEYKWSVFPRPYDANVLAVSHMYLDLYEYIRDERMVDKTGFAIDAHFVRHPAEPDVTFSGNRYWWSWWSWCDALFMAPPAFAKYARVTGDLKYLTKMDQLWKITHDYLYDNEEHLYFRDDTYFEKRTPGGKKVFWSRGNGWVMGGLAKVLQELPGDYSRRPFYENLFQQMAAKIAILQQKEGYWPSSLLDNSHYGGPETSGTAFFCYALAYGINSGLLEKKEYEKIVLKAWNLLCSKVNEEGMLGYVQKVGHGPDEIAPDDTEAYGSGAFLLAASEVYKLVK